MEWLAKQAFKQKIDEIISPYKGAVVRKVKFISWYAICSIRNNDIDIIIW